ncbi:MAG: CBS domain-containing protein [Bacteroidia bacterium]|nr:CBS domain-containing protein [Bacteroidia bacterium]
MATVRQLLASKGPVVWSVSPETTVFAALQLMAEKNIGAVVVTHADELVGIFSERDYARKVILHGKSSHNTTISDLMTRKVYFVKPNRSLSACLHLMTERRIRHLPVKDEGKLVGIITIGDVVKEMISEQANTIQELESYIAGNGYGA